MAVTAKTVLNTLSSVVHFVAADQPRQGGAAGITACGVRFTPRTGFWVAWDAAGRRAWLEDCREGEPASCAACVAARNAVGPEPGSGRVG